MANRAIAILILMVVGSLSVPSASSQERDSSGGLVADSPAVPSQAGAMFPRYFVADVRSYEGASGNVATGLKITNLSGRVCNYRVVFLYGASPGAVCSMGTNNIPNGRTSYFCFRGIPDTWGFPCDVTCNPELTFHDGKALILSSHIPRCDRMAINATIYHSTSDDGQIVATRTPTIIKQAVQETPWSNKGD